MSPPDEENTLGIQPPPPPQAQQSPRLKNPLPPKEEIVDAMKKDVPTAPIRAINKTATVAAMNLQNSDLQKAVPILGQNTKENFTSFVGRLASQTQKKRENSPIQPSTVSTIALLSYSTTKEKWLMFLGTIMAAISGCVSLFYCLIFI